MRPNPRRPLLALAVASFSALGAQAALADCDGAIRFAPGSDKGSVSGKIRGHDLCDDTLSARKDQVMTVTLDADNGAKAIVYEPVSHNFIAEPSLTLPQNGTWTLRVLQPRNAARKDDKARPFTMTLHISGTVAKAAAPRMTAAAVATLPTKGAAKGTTVAAAAATTCETAQALTADIGNSSGTINGDGLCDYSFDGRAGQTLRMMMDAAPEVDAILYDPVRATLERDGSYTLPRDGTYTVRVLQNRNAARNSSAARSFSMVLTLD